MTEDRLKETLEKLQKHNTEEPRSHLDPMTLKELYVGRGLSIREIAAELGLHPHTVHYHLRRCRIETRTPAKRSALRKIDLKTIKKNVREKGIRGYAKELGVHENTLRYYLRSVKPNRGKPTSRVA